MTNHHYFSQTPESESNPKYWDYTLKGRTFRFKSDSGVFSKNEVDFGSRLLIDTFDVPSIEGPILDAGCGYGPIGLAVASITPDRTIHMIDVNERALSLAEENAALNHIENVKIYESDRLQQVEETGFAAVLTNPPIRAGKNIIFDIFTQSYEKLATGGSLWVVIQKKQGAPSAFKKIESLFGQAEWVDRSKGYHIIKAEKY
ncbi:class I SAM-dependent methyltransferase [Bacillus thermotolerans]|uniref:Ribosomal RNA small subunit methyltransferase C n=1 Tax=Bacillus thermotolerans TaxID=1221996 RepID=A0A0F5HRF7_BACTR|nr:class I SAM-dependent methyltransferase [Bacillus thermotolerans]KKB34857.1 Ribosomal RNA small subunit methyltransferase C [Bacillus thermotolerans]KKB35848.1 Ribosomal RNA small subunit methyltransferase C [Bacillus thermotolerans]KKB40824.1 Ribosomal RNA small subunit methyltransferase C [Bacillus thermotolerans]